jgi:hypothetical protein
LFNRSSDFFLIQSSQTGGQVKKIGSKITPLLVQDHPYFFWSSAGKRTRPDKFPDKETVGENMQREEKKLLTQVERRRRRRSGGLSWPEQNDESSNWRPFL